VNPAELTPDNQAILKFVCLDYFWSDIPFARLHTALDVGAHIGLWSHVCQQHALHIAITAIEPHPDNYAQLVTNCPEVTAIHGYCGYEDMAGLCCRSKMEGSHYMLKAGEFPAQDSYTLTQLPRYTLEDLGAIDLLKLDCEGSEFDILLNCETDTLRRIQVVVGEYHLERGSLSQITPRLNECGFDVTIVPQTAAPHLGHFLAMRKPA
jgi:FkbM family methyltransferase